MIDSDLGFIGIVLSVLWVVLGVICAASIVGYEYEAICPYCGKSISVVKDTEALDCPVCGERIIIDNFKLHKK